MAAAIEVAGLTKRFDETLAVDDLSFTVEPGRIVGFLGPNGAGKTTTLRILLGLVNPTAGTATVEGRAYAALDDPVHTVGALLDGGMFHPGRSGRNHLRSVARASGVGDARVDELLELVALSGAAKRRAGGYSLGMRQRLGLAAALLGDPRVLVLDEPANGLDPQGIRWLRDFLRALAAAIGVGLGALIRNQVGAIIGALGWIFLVEPLLGIIPGFADLISKWFPSGAANATAGTATSEDALGQVPAGLLLAAYAAAFVAAGIVMMRRRDVSA